MSPASTGTPTRCCGALRPGDVAVLDQVDLDRATADALVAAEVVGGRQRGPVDLRAFPQPRAADPRRRRRSRWSTRSAPRCCTRSRTAAGCACTRGCVYAGEQVLAEGVAQTAESVADALVEAKSGLAHQLEAFAANTIEFMRRERGMLLDGVGVPDVEVELAGPPGARRRRRATTTSPTWPGCGRFIREYRPRLVGVGAGADALLAAGHRPDLIVGNPAEVSKEALTCGADVVVPAFTDGHAPGLHRVQDLGAGAVTFPSSANPEDLALLLAHHHGAAMIITVGLSATMGEFLDRGRSGSNASTFLTRLQTGGTVVDGAGGRRAVPQPDLGLAWCCSCSSRLVAAVVAALSCRAAGDGVLVWVQQGATAVVELVRGGVR